MVSFRGRSIPLGIVRNNSVRTAATIAYRAIDMIVKVSTDSYIGHRYSLKIIRNRLRSSNTFLSPISQSDGLAMIK